MNKEENATVQAQVNKTTDDGLTSAKLQTSKEEMVQTFLDEIKPPVSTNSTPLQTKTINILGRIYSETVEKLFEQWNFQEIVSLIEHTQRAIAGTEGKYEMSAEAILWEWSKFMSDYAAAYYTRNNFLGLRITDEALEVNINDKNNSHEI